MTATTSDPQPLGLAAKPPVTVRRVLHVWWPLAASWLLMGAEGPVVTAFLARSADSAIHLAAFSVTFNVALVVEAPIIMLLAASTALAVDKRAYRRLHRYMALSAWGLTALHALIAFTPLFDVVVRSWMDVPDEIVEPTRLGLRILLPWTGAIAYRRFQQGVLIRTEHSRRVMIGTALRLATGFTTISVGFALGWSGIVLAATTLSAGVLVEAAFAALAVRGPLATHLPEHDPDAEPIRLGRFLAFYLPLAATPLLVLGIQPIASATMSRMPRALDSLGAYHGVHSLVFLARSAGFAFNEVVVSLLGRPGAVVSLLAFARRLGVVVVGLLLLMAATPLGGLWFGHVQSFPPELASLAAGALAFALLMPANQVLQSWFGGILVKSGQTRGITEAVALYVALAAVLLGAGVLFQPTTGLVWTLGSLSLAGLGQALWLGLRARGALADFRLRETSLVAGRALPDPR